MIKDAAIEAGWEIAGEATNGQEAIDQYVASNRRVYPRSHHAALRRTSRTPRNPRSRSGCQGLCGQRLGSKTRSQRSIPDRGCRFHVKPFDRQFLIERSTSSSRPKPLHLKHARADVRQTTVASVRRPVLSCSASSSIPRGSARSIVPLEHQRAAHGKMFGPPPGLRRSAPPEPDIFCPITRKTKPQPVGAHSSSDR